MAESRWRLGAYASLAVALAWTVLHWPDRPWGDDLVFMEAAKDLTAPSRYPPGWPMLLSPLSWSVGAMQALGLAVAVALVGGLWWASVKVGGWRAGVACGPLVMLSPGISHTGERISSDPPAALFLVGALLAVIYGRDKLAGVLVGLSAWVRLVHVALVAAVPRRGWLPAGVLVVLLAGWLLVVQGALNPYDSGEASFAVGNIAGPVWLEAPGALSPFTNLEYYPVRMFGLESLYTRSVFGGDRVVAPFLIVPAVIGLRRHWGKVARFAVLLAAVNLVSYLPYFAQSGRFVLPGGCMLIVFAAAAVGCPEPAPEDGRVTESSDGRSGDCRPPAPVLGGYVRVRSTDGGGSPFFVE